MIAPDKLKEIIDREGDKHVPANIAAGKYLGVSLSTVYRMCDEGTLTFVLAGRVRGKRISIKSIYEHMTRPADS